MRLPCYADGLRLVVIATQDPEAGCANPGWNPDELICDDDGVLARALGAGKRLPAAFLWSWQGELLVNQRDVNEVEAAVQAWMRGAPRVDIDVPVQRPEVGIAADALEALVRSELVRSKKLTVIASDSERAAVQDVAAKSLSPEFDDALQCEIGSALSANSVLKASVVGQRRHRLQLSLLSAERGCLVGASVVGWNPRAGAQSVAEGVAELLDTLRERPRMPRDKRPRVSGETATPPSASRATASVPAPVTTGSSPTMTEPKVASTPSPEVAIAAPRRTAPPGAPPAPHSRPKIKGSAHAETKPPTSELRSVSPRPPSVPQTPETPPPVGIATDLPSSGGSPGGVALIVIGSLAAAAGGLTAVLGTSAVVSNPDDATTAEALADANSANSTMALAGGVTGATGAAMLLIGIILSALADSDEPALAARLDGDRFGVRLRGGF